MLRHTVLALLSLLICAASAEGQSQPARRVRPVPVLGVPRPLKLDPQSVPSIVQPVTSATLLPVTAASRLPATVGTKPPQVIIQPVTVTEAAVIAPLKPVTPATLLPVTAASRLPATVDTKPPQVVIQPVTVTEAAVIAPLKPVTPATLLPVTVASRLPAHVGTKPPQVVIQPVTVTEAAVIAPLKPVAVTPLRPPLQPPVAAKSEPIVNTGTEIPQVPVAAKEEPVNYEPYPKPKPEPQPEPQPEVKPEPKPEPQPEPKPQTEPAPKPEPQPQPETKPEPLPQPKPAVVLTPKPKQNQSLVAVPVVAPKLEAVKPVALPPLLPKPKPDREPAFGRQTPTPPTVVFTSATQRVTKAPPVSVPSAPSKRPEPFKYELVCQAGSGYYKVDNECDSYIECKYNTATKHWCPDGLHFNPSARRYEYPCAYPSVVQCTAGTDNRHPSPTDQCPRQYGFFSTKDGDCTKYIVCQEGAATLMNCPAGLVFNPTVQSCDWVANVPQCNPNVFKNYICPKPPLEDDGSVSDIIYKYRYEKHCKFYVACQKGYPRLLKCEQGLSFDEASQSCVHEDYVPDCATPYASNVI